LVPPPFAFGSKLAILLTKLVATLQQGPHQNPAGRLRLIGALQDPLRSNSVGFHAQAPDLRKPHPNETEIVFRQSPERHVKGNSKSTYPQGSCERFHGCNDSPFPSFLARCQFIILARKSGVKNPVSVHHSCPKR